MFAIIGNLETAIVAKSKPVRNLIKEMLMDKVSINLGAFGRDSPEPIFVVGAWRHLGGFQGISLPWRDCPSTYAELCGVVVDPANGRRIINGRPKQLKATSVYPQLWGGLRGNYMHNIHFGGCTMRG